MMRKFLLLLAPWMVMVASAQLTEQPSIVYTHYGTFDEGLRRDGDDLYVRPTVVQQFGWQAKQVRSEFEIFAESRRLRVKPVTLDGTLYLPLTECMEQLGARGEWIPGENKFVVTSQLRSMTLERGKLAFDTSMEVWPKVSKLSNPERLVIDLEGASYAANQNLILKLPPEVRIAQYRRTTLRIVIEKPGATRLALPNLVPSREFSVDVSSLKLGEPSDVASPKAPANNDVTSASTKPDEDPSKGFPGKKDAPPLEDGRDLPITENPPTTTPFNPNEKPITAKPVPIGARVMKPKVVPQKNGTVLVVFPYTGKLTQQVGGRYDDSLNIRIPVPGAEPEVQTSLTNLHVWLEAVNMKTTSNGLELILQTDRPYGIKVSNTAKEIQVMLVKPKAGSGTLLGKTIVVDAGHGGTDPGAISPDGTVKEKNVVMPIAKYLAAELTLHGAQAVMTRDEDVKIALTERSSIANRIQADFFISIHINSNKVANTRSGTMIFHHKQEPLGKLLAECISREVGKVSELPNMGVVSDGRIYDSGFAVLRNSTMPGVLCELGFINHSKDRKRMVTADFQKKIAEAIVRGIQIYLGERKPNENP